MIEEADLNHLLKAGVISADQAAQDPTHTSLVQLFADIRTFVRQHPGAQVVCADDPMTRQLGWVASNTEGDFKRFTLSLTGLKAAQNDLAPDDVLRAEITQPDGRARIAGRLMAEGHGDRGG